MLLTNPCRFNFYQSLPNDDAATTCIFSKQYHIPMSPNASIFRIKSQTQAINVRFSSFLLNSELHPALPFINFPFKNFSYNFFLPYQRMLCFFLTQARLSKRHFRGTISPSFVALELHIAALTF